MKKILVILPVLVALTAALLPAQSAEERLAELYQVLAELQAPPAPPAPPTPPTPPVPPAPPRARAYTLSIGTGSYLGIGVQEITSERAKALKLSEERGVEVTRVDEDSPAAKAGLKEDDVVLEYNGQRVEGTEQFVRLVRETPPGRQVKLLISRNGVTQTITATIGERKGGAAFALGPQWQTDMKKFQEDMRKFQDEMKNSRLHLEMDLPGAMMSWRSGMLGVEAESLTTQLAEFFGVKEGVLVRSVTRDSAAEKAGIKAGDVITKVDGNKVTSPGEITRTIRALGSKRTFPVTVVRNRLELALGVTLEEPARPPAPARRIQALPRVERRLLPRPRVTSVQGVQL